MKDRYRPFIRLYFRFRNLILYGLIGTCSSGLDFVVYSLLVLFVNLPYIVANSISVLIGITTSFILNRKYNFKVRDKVLKRFFVFLFIGICGLFMSNLILYFCIDLLCMDSLFSKLLSIIMVVFLQFLLDKYVTFKVKTTDGKSVFRNASL